MPRSTTPAESSCLAFGSVQMRGVAVDRRLSSATAVAAGASVRTIVASRHVDVAPAFRNDEGLSNRLAFGAQSRGLSARYLRFAARLATEPRKTRLRLVANLTARDWVPAGSLSRFQLLHRFLLGQAFLAQFEFELDFSPCEPALRATGLAAQLSHCLVRPPSSLIPVRLRRAAGAC
jgi:hypothetical protein